MSSTPTVAPDTANAASRRKSVMLVASCTILGAASQLLIKIGMTRLVVPENHGFAAWALALAVAILGNLPLFAGYALYGVVTVLLVLALRDGELSMLYPIIALTYVWVTLLSYALLPEKPNVYKNVGIATIVIGVAVLGRGGRKA